MESNTQQQCIYIPIATLNGKAVRIDLNQLPAADRVLEVLTQELAPLDLWLKLANEYYKQERISEFLQILKMVLSPEVEQHYAESKLERIAMLNALASYYTQLGQQEKEKSKRDEHFSYATFHFTKADRIDPHQSITWIGKAVLLLTRGDYERAESNFKQVLELASKDSTLPILPAKLGAACILFNQNKYDKALDTYQKVILQNSNCSPSVRLGLGYCYFKLNRMKKAKESFKRVLELDRDNVEAMIGLSLVLMNENQIADAMNLILQAYQLAPTNPIVLNHLANHYFYRGEYQKSNTLGIAAFTNTDVAHIKAESGYIVGRAFHATKRYSEALQYYHQATLKNPDFYLAQFGLGQIYIHNEDYDKAISCFEQVLSKQPNNYETLQILGSLYKHGSLYKQSKNSTTTTSTTTNLTNATPIEKIKNVLKKATELNPNDSSNWFELGQVLETTEVSFALDAYEKGFELLKKEGTTPSLELLNNVAVLRQQKGLFNEAEQTYLEIIKQSGYELEEFKSINTTCTYNLALLYESMGQINKAESLYRGIVKEHPNYTDCYLRLSAIAKSQGDTYEAAEWIKECLEIQIDSQEAWSLFGNLHLSKEEWYHAQKKFEQIIDNGTGQENKNESYASLSLGNIYYNAKFSNPEKVDKYLNSAEQFYNRILTKNNSNIYAANGIGMIIAEKGNMDLAKQTFLQIREAAIDCIPVSINLAHVYMVNGLYDNAIKLYDGCLKKSVNPKEIEIILGYLAKAYYEANRFIECKQTLKKALHQYPHNQAILFNLAICIESYSKVFIGKRQKNAAETGFMIIELEFAAKSLANLSQVKSTPKLAFAPSKAKSHQQEIEKTLVTLRSDYEKLSQIEAIESKKRGLAFEQVKKLEEEKRIKDIEDARLAEEKLEEERLLAEELQEKAKEILKTNKPSSVDDDGYGNNDGDNGGSKKRKKKSKKEDGDGGDGEEGSKKKKRSSRKKSKENGEGGEGDESSTLSKKEKKQKKKEKKEKKKSRKEKKQKKQQEQEGEEENQEGEELEEQEQNEDEQPKEEQEQEENTHNSDHEEMQVDSGNSNSKKQSIQDDDNLDSLNEDDLKTGNDDFFGDN